MKTYNGQIFNNTNFDYTVADSTSCASGSRFIQAAIQQSLVLSHIATYNNVFFRVQFLSNELLLSGLHI